MPDDTVVKTGHGDDTTIGAERGTIGVVVEDRGGRSAAPE
jgi:hypothetical protein